MDERERLFAIEYIACKGNAYQAALNAGYRKRTAKSAYEWLLETLPNPTAKRHLPYKPELVRLIEKEQERIHSEKTADAKEVLEYLTSVMRGESEAEVVVVEGCGEGFSEAVKVCKSPDEKERLRAAELLGKTMLLFTDKVNVEGGTTVVIVDDLEE